MAIFDLSPIGPFHLGEFVGINREVTLDWIPSDTLFSALVTAWFYRGLDVNKRLAEFIKKPRFILTSAFPRAGRIRFFPAPARIPRHSGLFSEGSAPKAAKKIHWISAGVLDTLVNGNTPDTNNENFLNHGTTWLTSIELQQLKSVLVDDTIGKGSLWSTQVVPHVALDRVSSASNLFHTGRVAFQPGCGLWFGVRGDTNWIKEGLDYLADAGLGGLRSTGYGAFKWKIIPEDLPDSSGIWGLCLSRYAPNSSEEIINGLQIPGSAYKLVTIGGWCQDDHGHSWRRRSVRMLAEGALIPTFTKGNLVDVRPLKPEAWLGPQRPVYRYGLAYLIPAGQLAEVE